MVITTARSDTAGQPPKRTCDLGSGGATAYATGRAMGTDCQVRATCDSASEALAAVGGGWQGIVEYDRSWTRFTSDSELTTLNNSASHQQTTTVLSDSMAALVAGMVWAFEYSGGWVDASLLHAVVAAGYDRDFAEIAAAQLENQPARNNGVPGPRDRSAQGMEWVSIHGNRLTRTQYVTLDSGGIGKGLAADLVAESIVAAGAKGALVDLGGDIRAIGVDQHGRPWSVQAADERNPSAPEIAEWDVSDAGIATSSVARRRWNGGHHLIDPRTGLPSESDLLAVTVLHRNALTAEVAAKSALLMGRRGAVDWLRDRAATAVLTGVDGLITRIDRTED